jgi:hypothetical protein
MWDPPIRHRYLSLCVCVWDPPISTLHRPLLDNEPQCLIAGSDLHRCSTRDVAALLLLLVPLATGALEEATEATTSATEASTEAGLLDR